MDTEYNNGVLIYLLLADRDVEIVADRGVHAKVTADAIGSRFVATWKRIFDCRDTNRESSKAFGT
jgi:uncharacterized membrane protein